MTRAYSYLRFSSPEQSKGDSARRQSAAAVAYAARHGLELDDRLTFEDLGVSAYRGRNASEGRLGDFLAAVEAGDVPPGSYLLVESLDRISREAPLDALQTLQRLVGAGITLVTLTDGHTYSSETLREDPLSLMSFVMLSSRANEESKIKGLRVRAAWEAKRAQAKDRPLTKWCPAWLRLKEDRSAFEVIPERAEVVRRVFELAAGGMGQHSIAACLNADGVPTFGDDGRRAPAAMWHRSYLAKIINGDAALGTYVPHRTEYRDGRTVRVPGEPVRDYYPAVVDEETARRARLVVGPGENVRRGRHATRPVQNILAGLARCPLCGGAMTRVSKGSAAKAGRPYLVCVQAKAGVGCVYKAVPLHAVEHAIRDRPEQLIYRAVEDEEDHVLAELQGQLETAQRQVRNYADAVGRGPVTDVLLQRLALAEGEAKALTARIARHYEEHEERRSARVSARLADLRDALAVEPFDVGRANSALRVCADAVVVDYMNGVLDVSWRHGAATDPLVFSMPLEDEERERLTTAARGPKGEPPVENGQAFR